MTDTNPAVDRPDPEVPEQAPPAPGPDASQTDPATAPAAQPRDNRGDAMT